MSAENGMREHDDVEAALAAALRPRDVDDAAARAAVAAFRAARDTGLHISRRTRRRDDWRPVPERGTGRSLKTSLAALAASLTLGGVAFAAAASHSPSDEMEARDPQPRRSTSAPQPSKEPVIAPFESPDSSPPAAHGVPTPRVPHDQAHLPRSDEALCRAYEKSPDKGKAMEAAARQRLVAAADAKDVATYCDSLLASAPPDSPPAPGNGHSAPAESFFGTRTKPEVGNPVRRPSMPASDSRKGSNRE
ncbi:hypothetical protein [Streptomyces sp. TLI_105]|uniref:hypothetical protein n=1 Tax=Streptomyces sp. TLI_105 TaxID=1881019 RepID=UPI0008966F89|nr:hypothetical protein [Streptomyces sp. TLI_105]SED80194.1 hypothetical protein SAMN05428939_6296 [Streptomyces sp. TLI_105]